MSNVHRINIKTDREEQKQKKLSDIFIQQKKPPTSTTNKDEKFILSRRLVIWFCRDLLPISTVENYGFSNFWKSLNQSIKLPTRANVSVNALDDMYNVLKENLLLESKNSPGNFKIHYADVDFHCVHATQIHEQIKRIWNVSISVHCAITTDGWTDDHVRQSYTT